LKLHAAPGSLLLFFGDRLARPKSLVSDDARYEAHKAAARERNALASKAGRDIGKLPPVLAPRRKAKAAEDFLFFCREYFPDTFFMAWSKDQGLAAKRIEQSVRKGGLFALAMPRGSGKTCMCEIACIWAILYGYRDFVAIIGPEERHAENMLVSIKSEIQNNTRLAADFPEVCYPINRLEGIANRTTGQLQFGVRTLINWTSKQITLPTIKDSKSSGAVIRVVGLTGQIRGMNWKRPDGRVVRPDLVVLDDPQTDDSARSPLQCATRENLVAGAVLGLAGPGKKIAGVMPCTVIRPGDMADNVLDRQKHPQWQGQRTKMVYSFPNDIKIWEDYNRIRIRSLQEDKGIEPATEFYRENRAAMDLGAIIAWEERYDEDELSAIQHAMNKKFQNERVFAAEYQNSPLEDNLGDVTILTASEIAKKVNGMKRKEIRTEAQWLTMHIDVQLNLLYYTVVAWGEGFTGDVIDYGTYPEQHAPYFTAATARQTLALKYPSAGFEGSLYAGLDALTKKTLAKEWFRDDGSPLRINKCLVDANWGRSTDAVYQFCRQSPHASILMPAHGQAGAASSKPFNEYVKKRGDLVGNNWRVPARKRGTKTTRHLLYDVNHFKSFIHARFATSMGDPGSLALFQADPVEHQMFAEQLHGEYRIRTFGRGREVDEWKEYPEHRENHYLDNVAGAAVAASLIGVKLATSGGKHKRRARISLAEYQKRKKSK